MHKKRKLMHLVVAICLFVMATVFVVSCGSSKDGGGSNTGNTVTYTSASQAAAGASSAKAAADLSNAMSIAAADLTSSSNPSGYAPGKVTSTVDTASLANLDPSLKGAVDNMLAVMQSQSVKNAATSVRSKASMISMATGTTITVSGPCSGGTGTYSVTGTDTSSPVTYNEYTVDIGFTNCQDVAGADYNVLTGSIHVYDKEMTDLSSTIRNATVNLTSKKYAASALTKTYVLTGTFDVSDATTATGRAGTNRADGSFTETVASSGQVNTFYFTNLTNNWSTTTATNSRVDTVNGSFGFSSVSTGGSLRLDIALSNMESKARTNGDGSKDQWINGSMNITWTPDLTAWGCVAGKITFTTADATPLHYATALSTCPASGTLQVNNATIVYGSPITVTVGTDSKTYGDCAALGSGGMCQ